MASDLAAYRDAHELVHRREAAASNEMWQADHTVLDILVLDDAETPVRPWLTVMLDDHSRAITGYFISLNAPSAVNTALALRQAIWRLLRIKAIRAPHDRATGHEAQSGRRKSVSAGARIERTRHHRHFLRLWVSAGTAIQKNLHAASV